MAVEGSVERLLRTDRTTGFTKETTFVTEPAEIPTDKTTPTFLPIPMGTRLRTLGSEIYAVDKNELMGGFTPA